MKITPDYIRAKQEENRAQVAAKVDKIMKVYVTDMVCNGSAHVVHKHIMAEGISLDEFRDELRRRGFSFSVQHENGRFNDDPTLIVTLPPDGE